MKNMNVTVLYGSETGTAQDVAEQIWKSAKRRGFYSTVSAMENYKIQNLVSEKLIIFVIATTGQGDPPHNMTKFWKLLLRKHLPLNLLANLKYGVLGLGDSSYQKYNFAAKKLNKRVAQLGGKELLAIGLADDQHDLGIDAVVDSWVQELWMKIEYAFDISVRNMLEDQDVIIERFSVSEINERDTSSKDNVHSLNSDIYMQKMSVKHDLKIGAVIENVRTTAEDHFQDVRLIKIQSSDITYQPGDIIYIRPKNSLKQVERFFQVLNNNNVQIHAEMLIQVLEKEIKVPEVLKQTLTLRQIAEQYWDLSFKPRRSTMKTLSLISENELEKEKLQEFTTSRGQEDLYSYINRPRRNILEVLADFPHTTSKMNIKLLFEIMSPIKPRAFSIASSSLDTKAEVHILVAVVKYKTKLLEPRLGLCSNWLASLRNGDRLIFWIQTGTFKFMHDRPMILIGPGTGVAPFRSLLLDKAALNQKLNECVLFFGCRHKEKDYHCRKDFERLSREKNLKHFSAFSRDRVEKVYVQDVIRNEKELCWNFLKNGANVYLAGNSKNMPNCVRAEFIELIMDAAGLTKLEAEDFVQRMEKSNRYQTETWG